jgi:hypothetical protein
VSRRNSPPKPPGDDPVADYARAILGHTTAADRSLLETAARKTTVRIVGEKVDLSLLDATMLKMCQEAIGGNSHAAWLVSDRVERARELNERDRHQQLIFWIRLKSRHRAKIRAALEAGKPEPLLFPHPDDMEFNKEELVTINGPLNEEQHFACLRSCRRRDALITQYALECALDGSRRCRIDAHVGSLAWAMTLDRGLPTRMQLAEDGFNRMTTELLGLTKRELLKRAFAAWRRADSSKPRGWRMPDRSWIEHMLRTAGRIASDILGAAKAGDSSEETINSILKERFARTAAHTRASRRQPCAATSEPI